jgi:hypothetical protein
VDPSSENMSQDWDMAAMDKEFGAEQDDDEIDKVGTRILAFERIQFMLDSDRNFLVM